MMISVATAVIDLNQIDTFVNCILRTIFSAFPALVCKPYCYDLQAASYDSAAVWVRRKDKNFNTS